MSFHSLAYTFFFHSLRLRILQNEDTNGGTAKMSGPRRTTGLRKLVYRRTPLFFRYVFFFCDQGTHLSNTIRTGIKGINNADDLNYCFFPETQESQTFPF